MKPIFLTLVFALSAYCIAMGKDGSDAPLPAQFVEIRGERIPVYESLKGLGTPSTVKPEFPRDEKGRRISGTALVGVLVDEKGKPIEIEVIESKPIPAFGASAAASVKKWRFPKLKAEGKMTKYMVRVPMVFKER
jgi:TonB family protein